MVADEADLPALEDEARRLVDHLKTLNAVNEGLGAAAGRVDGATASLERVREDVLAATGLLDETRASTDAVLAHVRALDPASLRLAIDARFDRQEAADAERDRAIDAWFARQVATADDRADALDQRFIRQESADAARAEALDARLGALEAAQQDVARTVGALLTALGETEQRLLRDAEQRQQAVSEQVDSRLRGVGGQVATLQAAVTLVEQAQDAFATTSIQRLDALQDGQREARGEVGRVGEDVDAVQRAVVSIRDGATPHEQAVRMQVDAAQKAIAEGRADAAARVDAAARDARDASARHRVDARWLAAYVVLLVWLALVVYALTEHGLLTQLLRRGG